MAILFIDNAGGVYKTELQTGQTLRLADYAEFWTDIAITPQGQVYATTFSGLYALDLDTNERTFLRSLGGNANGLESDADGNLYVGYASATGIDVLDADDFAVIDSIEMPDFTTSAGDIHIEGETLYYAASNRVLYSLDLDTGAVIDNAYHNLSALYGLQYEDDTLFGLANNDVYTLDPATGASQAVFELPISGQVNGAATLAGVTVRGSDDRDILQADIGGSELRGLGGKDILIGSDVSDKLFGGAGRDIVLGGKGKDVIDGGAGRDILEGERGADKVTGGAGRDSFVFDAHFGKDTVKDFEIDVDQLEIAASLLGSVQTTASHLLDAFGSIRGGDAYLDFGGGDRIKIKGIDDLSDLEDDIFIF